MRTAIATAAVATGGTLPAPAAEALKRLGWEIDRLEIQLALIEAKLMKRSEALLRGQLANANRRRRSRSITRRRHAIN